MPAFPIAPANASSREPLRRYRFRLPKPRLPGFPIDGPARDFLGESRRPSPEMGTSDDKTTRFVVIDPSPCKP